MINLRTKRKAPTKKQIKVLFFIAEYKTKRGWPVTLHDISKHYKFTVKAAVDHVNSLERKGLVTKDGSARSIRITDEGKEILDNHGILNNTIYEGIEFK
ncbi:MAG: winged helix DNA-binding protein [Candidatus Marinimicrobia bacterium]|nr:winged helix DNA-binding protein [Candidatus Neomarinimicrobiota bacterium]